MNSADAGAGSFVCSFRFALAILCFLVTMILYAARIGMSIAIVCMVNHTALAVMRDAREPSSSSSSIGIGENVTSMTPGEWQTNKLDDANEQSPCAANLFADSNRSAATVSKDQSSIFAVSLIIILADNVTIYARGYMRMWDLFVKVHVITRKLLIKADILNTSGTSDIFVLKLISVLVFILFSGQNFYFI